MKFGEVSMVMKKISKLLVTIMLLSLTAGLTCTHVHDDQCGYNPETGEGCTHVCEYDISPLNEDKDGGI